MRIVLITVVFFFLPFFAQASTGDSLRVVLPTDTLVLTINEAGQKLIKHVLAPKQTLYKISRFYGISIAKIMALNPDKQAKNLSVGDTLIVPLSNRVILRFRKKGFDPKRFVKLYYLVKKGDTLYGIAKRHFRMPVDTLVKRNHLKGGIAPGQMLHVGWVSLKGAPAGKGRTQPAHPLSGKVYHEKLIFEKQAESKKLYKQRGAAYWNKSESTSGKLFALHNYAPVGSVIKVYNPMSKMTLFVKVIGRINPRVTPANVKVVLSSGAAGYLGAINNKFYTEIEYYR